MTTPVETEPGYKVGHVFYPFVPIENWKRGDTVLVSKLTGLGDELFNGSHSIALQNAFLAVAIWRANPQQSMERIIDHVYSIGIDDVEEIGFPEEGPEGEQSVPPADAASTDSNSSPASGEEPSDSPS